MEVTVKPLQAGDICHYSEVMLTVVQTTACFGESAYLECTGEQLNNHLPAVCLSYLECTGEQLNNRLPAVCLSHLECTVEQLDDQVKLGMIQHSPVALDMITQLFDKAEPCRFVLQSSQHRRKYLPTPQWLRCHKLAV